jgi:hypothetical protein
MLMRGAVICAATLLFTACAAQPRKTWQRAGGGGDVQEWGRDNASCMAQAEQSFPPRYPPPMPGPTVQIGRPGIQFNDGSNLDQSAGRRHSFFMSCMAGNGWQLR